LAGIILSLKKAGVEENANSGTNVPGLNVQFSPGKLQYEQEFNFPEDGRNG
jgi:hypothetical protein